MQIRYPVQLLPVSGVVSVLVYVSNGSPSGA